MRNILLFTIILTSGTLFSQSQQPTISKINFGDTLHYENISVEFVKLISDSRCPKNVNCIRAGEAKIWITIHKNGKFVKQKELIFYASGVVDAKTNVLYASESVRISGLALFPYPETPNKIRDKEYCLEIKIN